MVTVFVTDREGPALPRPSVCLFVKGPGSVQLLGTAARTSTEGSRPLAPRRKLPWDSARCRNGNRKRSLGPKVGDFRRIAIPRGRRRRMGEVVVEPRPRRLSRSDFEGTPLLQPDRSPRSGWQVVARASAAQGAARRSWQRPPGRVGARAVASGLALRRVQPRPKSGPCRNSARLYQRGVAQGLGSNGTSGGRRAIPRLPRIPPGINI